MEQFFEKVLGISVSTVENAYEETIGLLRSLLIGKDEIERFERIAKENIAASEFPWDRDPSGYMTGCIFDAAKEVIRGTYPGAEFAKKDGRLIVKDGIVETVRGLRGIKSGPVILFINSGAREQLPVPFIDFVRALDEQQYQVQCKMEDAKEAARILEDISDAVSAGNKFVVFDSIGDLGRKTGDKAASGGASAAEKALCAAMYDECGLSASDPEYGEWLISAYRDRKEFTAPDGTVSRAQAVYQKLPDGKILSIGLAPSEKESRRAIELLADTEWAKGYWETGSKACIRDFVLSGACSKLPIPLSDFITALNVHQDHPLNCINILRRIADAVRAGNEFVLYDSVGDLGRAYEEKNGKTGTPYIVSGQNLIVSSLFGDTGMLSLWLPINGKVLYIAEPKPKVVEEQINVDGAECTLQIDVEGESMALFDDVIKVELYNNGEGLRGDYNPGDPDDINLLRFDVYVYNPDGDPEYLTDWVEVEDASYCTQIPAGTDISVLRKLISKLFREYRDAIDSYEDYLCGSSVKKLGERLSWISPEWAERKTL